MEELAGAFVNRVVSMPEDPAIARGHLCEALFSLLVCELKAGSKPFDIPFRDYYVVIRTAIAGTFRAVIKDWELSVDHKI